MATLLALSPASALAHASDQALVLLMPTGLYSAIGAAIVALTAIMLALLPDHRVIAWVPDGVLDALPRRPPGNRCWPGLITTVVVLALLGIGVLGPHDPLRNLLPLGVWTLWWIGFTALVGVLGDPWPTINPWSGLLRHVYGLPADRIGPWRMPLRWGRWPAVLSLLLFMAVLLADPAPDDPTRLATWVAVYWASTLLAMLAFGEREWLQRGELFSAVFASYGAVAKSLRRRSSRRSCDVVTQHPSLRRGSALLCIALLASGSFDGLNESFWWLDLLGVNPFEYPGRSAMIGRTVLGLLLFVLVLGSVLLACVAAGLALAGAPMSRLGAAVDALAPTLLPIAFAYHVAHYLASFLVNGQYALVAISDPMGSGLNWMGLQPWFVSTGFFNVPGTVRLLWLAQAAAVVGGHLLALLLAHRASLSLFDGAARARRSQLPLVVFMLGYTLFGLWLLATPRVG